MGAQFFGRAAYVPPDCAYAKRGNSLRTENAALK
jgi:hypothetical protein